MNKNVARRSFLAVIIVRMMGEPNAPANELFKLAENNNKRKEQQKLRKNITKQRGEQTRNLKETKG